MSLEAQRLRSSKEALAAARAIERMEKTDWLAWPTPCAPRPRRATLGMAGRLRGGASVRYDSRRENGLPYGEPPPLKPALPSRHLACVYHSLTDRLLSVSRPPNGGWLEPLFNWEAGLQTFLYFWRVHLNSGDKLNSTGEPCLTLHRHLLETAAEGNCK
jgi:hypothetical protein